MCSRGPSPLVPPPVLWERARGEDLGLYIREKLGKIGRNGGMKRKRELVKLCVFFAFLFFL